MPNWTPEQELALNTTDRTVLLSAAAGSGKTATLINRLIRMIIRDENPLDVSRMLVATFSRAAAAELREKIAAAVAKEQAESNDALLALRDREKASPNEENRAAVRHAEARCQRLLLASLLLPSAAIRTINSFCNDLVKGHAQEIGIPPHYRILDEAEAELLSGEIMDGLITDAFDGRYAPEGLDVSYLVDCVTEARREGELTGKLTKLYKSLGGYPDGLSLLRHAQEEAEASLHRPYFDSPWGKVIRDELLDNLSEFAALLSKARVRAREEAYDVYLAKLDAPIGDMITSLEAARGAAKESYTSLKKALESFPLPSLSSPNDLPTEASLTKRLANEIKTAIKDLRARFFAWGEEDIPFAMQKTAVLLRSISLLLEEFDRRYMTEKRRLSAFTFSDLEHFAFRLLYTAEGERTPLARELSEAYDAICIDEYQDVNDLQHLIFVAISKPTNRFMVGDIKQSIYAFRGAKPAIFAKLRAEMPAYEDGADEAVLYLTKNFRSHDHLIRFNNAVFDFLFEEFKESIGYRAEDALHTGHAPAEAELPLPLVFYTYTPPKSEDSTTEWDIVAQKIEQLLREGGKDDGTALKPSDIAILYKKGTEKPVLLAEALRERGIPVLSKDTHSFFENPEVLLALCLLHTVNNPHRDIYLAGLLRSPLYRFDMEALLRIRREKDGSLFDALRAYTEAHEDFEAGKQFLSELASFRAIAESERADKLCRLLFEKTGLYALTDAEGKKHLEALYEYAKGYETGSYRGLYRFLSHLNELYESGGGIGADRVLGDADGVKIMTMHASKGLEFPVCFIVDTKVAPSHRKDIIPFHPALGIGASIRDESGLAVLRNPLAIALDVLRKREELEESARVLYVALTRASEQMYISAHATSKPEKVLADAELLRAYPSRYFLAHNHFFEWVLAASLERSELCRYKLGENTEVAPFVSAYPFPPPDPDRAALREQMSEAEANAAAEEAVPDSVAEAQRKMQERFSFVYPHEAEASLPGKVSVSVLYPSFLDEETEEARASLANAAKAPEGEEKESETVPFFLSGIEGDLALKAGIATHLFLQFCDFAALKGQSDEQIRLAIQRETDRLRAMGFLHSTDAARVRQDEILKFVKSDLHKDILSAHLIRREFRFNTFLPASLFAERDKERYEELSVFTQGVIDLLIQTEEGEIILADYKTDRLTREMLADEEKAKALLFGRYRHQLTYYALAIERIFGKRPIRIEIYSLHAGKSFLLPLDED